jgi:hypothetical protein
MFLSKQKSYLPLKKLRPTNVLEDLNTAFRKYLCCAFLPRGSNYQWTSL